MSDRKFRTRSSAGQTPTMHGAPRANAPTGQPTGTAGTAAQMSGPAPLTQTRSVAPAATRPAVTSQGPQIASATSTAAAAGNSANAAPFLPQDNAGGVIASSQSSGSSAGAGADQGGDIDWAELRSSLFAAMIQALEFWSYQARFENVTINSVSAISGPGSLVGPALASAPPTSAQSQSTGPSREILLNMFAAFSDSFGLWQMGAFIPGLPLFPAFAAFPGPQAPPMPATPFNLIGLPSSFSNALSKSALKSAFAQRLGSHTGNPQTAAFIDNIATSVELGMTLWRTTAVTRNLMGEGPVPSFRPPLVPVGPVVGGRVLPAPCFVGIPSANFVNLPHEIYLG